MATIAPSPGGGRRRQGRAVFAKPGAREGEEPAQGGIVSLAPPDGADLQPRPGIAHRREPNARVATIGDAFREEGDAVAGRDQGQQAFMGAVVRADVH